MSATASTSPNRVAEWTTRLDHVADEIQQMFHDRQVWQSLSAIAAANPVVVANPFIVNWIGTLYYRRAMTAIRAMVDPGMRGKAGETDSLVTVLEDIARRADQLQVSAYSGMQAANAATIDPAKVRDDIDRLKVAAAATKKYTNNYIAHLDRQPTVPVPTLTEIEQAIDLIGELLQKYTLLLTGADLELGIKVLFDWTAVFTVPWLDRSLLVTWVGVNRSQAGRSTTGRRRRAGPFASCSVRRQLAGFPEALRQLLVEGQAGRGQPPLDADSHVGGVPYRLVARQRVPAAGGQDDDLD